MDEQNNFQVNEEGVKGRISTGSAIAFSIAGVLIAAIIVGGMVAWKSINVVDDIEFFNEGNIQIDTEGPNVDANLLSYNDTKFNIGFDYSSELSLQSEGFSIDATLNGRNYICPWNGSQRIYSEREVNEGNVDVSNCTYKQPDINSAAESQFQAIWSVGLYGAGQNIESITVDGQTARLVYGSTEYRALIVELPSPYVENGYTYDFLIITANTDLMDDILMSLSFN